MNEGDAASKLFGQCAAVLVAERSDIELDCIWRMRHDHVSVRARTSSFRPAMMSWISVAFSGPSVQQAKRDTDIGERSASSSNRATMLTDAERRGRSR